MEFLINFGLYILAGIFISCAFTESMMTYLSVNDRWRIKLTKIESMLTVGTVFSLGILGGYIGVLIQESFAVASSNLSLFTDNPKPVDFFVELAPKSEAVFMSFICAALLSLSYVYINNYWINKRRKELYQLKILLNSCGLKYGNSSDKKQIKARIDSLTSTLYVDTKAYCP